MTQTGRLVKHLVIVRYYWFTVYDKCDLFFIRAGTSHTIQTGYIYKSSTSDDNSYPFIQITKLKILHGSRDIEILKLVSTRWCIRLLYKFLQSLKVLYQAVASTVLFAAAFCPKDSRYSFLYKFNKRHQMISFWICFKAQIQSNCQQLNKIKPCRKMIMWTIERSPYRVAYKKPHGLTNTQFMNY